MQGQKPTLLLIARNYPPLTGGIEHLMQATLESLVERYDVLLLGPTGCRQYAGAAKRVVELPTGALLFLLLGLLMAPLLGVRHRPEWVLTSNGLMAPLGHLAAFTSGARKMGFLHGLDLTTSNRVYRTLFLPLLRRIKTMVVNSSNTRRLAIDRGLQPEFVHVIHPCIREPAAAVAPSTPLQPGYLLYAGRIIPRKGLLEFIQANSNWLIENDMQLVIAGDSPRGSVEGSRGKYAAQLRSACIDKGIEERVHFLGVVSDGELAWCFQHAGLHIMPLVEIAGDVEGFGMVVVEAASHGTATVAFNCGGVGDAIADPSCLVKPGDYAELRHVITKQLNTPPDKQVLRAWAAGFYRPAYQQKLNALMTMPRENL
ncbi:MAG: glycosyltransferase family 4 protein [Pseudomonadota bacterium]